MTHVVDLFSGIGGFSLGFERAGFQIVVHVEKDANCRKLLDARWPEAVSLDDVATAGRHNLPDCDVVTFGFPCQDLSIAGKRGGLAGKRSGLFYEATRIVDELRPAYCLFENVPGLLSSENGRDFALVLMEMDRIGYHGAWRVLDAQWFGVAQRRRRVFGLFTRLDSGAERCAEILSIPESLRGHPPPRRESWQSVAGCLESRTDGGGFPGTDGACAGHVVPVVAQPIRTNIYNNSDPGMESRMLIPAVAATLRSASDNPACHGKTNGTDRMTLVPVAFTTEQTPKFNADRALTLTKQSPSGGGQPQAVAFQPRIARNGRGNMGDVCNALQAQSGRTGKGDAAPCVAMINMQGSKGNAVAQADGPSYSLNAMHGHDVHAIAVPTEQAYKVRRLTPTECLRLQNFPDNWFDGLNFSDSVKYRCLGNAVCVAVIEWIACRIGRLG